MKIQINNYDPAVFALVELYLQNWKEWEGTPEDRFVDQGFVTDDFLKNLNHGKLDSNEYNVVIISPHFNVKDFLIIQRYYFENLARHQSRNQYIIDNKNSRGRMYREAGLKRPTSRPLSYRGGKKSSSRRIKKRTTRTRTRTRTMTMTRTRPRTRKCHLLL